MTQRRRVRQVGRDKDGARMRCRTPQTRKASKMQLCLVRTTTYIPQPHHQHPASCPRGLSPHPRFLRACHRESSRRPFAISPFFSRRRHLRTCVCAWTLARARTYGSSCVFGRAGPTSGDGDLPVVILILLPGVRAWSWSSNCYMAILACGLSTP